jgi:hypothetical protein
LADENCHIQQRSRHGEKQYQNQPLSRHSIPQLPAATRKPESVGFGIAPFVKTQTRAFSVLIESEPGLYFVFDAFSKREPASTWLENAPAARCDWGKSASSRAGARWFFVEIAISLCLFARA